MTEEQKQAIDCLVLNSQKIVACVSRQGPLGFLVEEAFEALERARGAGLTPPLVIATSNGVQSDPCGE